MIEINDIHKSFGEHHVLRGISTIFEPGKCNLIIGRSGAGKTVFLKCLVGLMNPERGQILYNGRDIVEMSDHMRKDIRRELGMLFQGNALFDSMTVAENVRFPLDMFTKMSAREKKSRVDYCLEKVHLTEARKKFPGEISGGMMKRVGIARSIVQKPKYLFCDEPNSGLDPKTSIVIDELIHTLTQELNMTTIVNTHDMNSVMGIGDKVLYLQDGVKSWEGTKDQILQTENTDLNDFIFASKFFKELKKAASG